MLHDVVVVVSPLLGVGSHLITNDDTAGRRVISSLMYALTRYIPLVVETLLRAWLYHGFHASREVGLDRVEVDDGR